MALWCSWALEQRAHDPGGWCVDRCRNRSDPGPRENAARVTRSVLDGMRTGRAFDRPLRARRVADSGRHPT